MEEILNFVDIETTGSQYGKDQILEIAILKIKNGEVIESFETLIKPSVKIGYFEKKIHGISDDMVQDSPRFAELAEKINDLLSEGLFVAHNARFDYGFIRRSLEEHGHEFTRPYLCTVKLSRILYPTHRKHGLSAIIDRHEIEIKDRHRAMGDTYATFEFYEKAREEHEDIIFEDAHKKAISYNAVPSKLMRFNFKKIPNTTGIYILKSEAGTPIYIGKSLSIRDRVKQHFYGSLTNSKEMDIYRSVADIDYEETVGEVGALLREVLLIKKHQPQFNHMLKAKSNIALEKFYDDKGFIKLRLKNINSNEDIDFENTLGLFKSRLSAKKYVEEQVEQYDLCGNILDKKQGACFKYHLGKCSGACTGKANVEEYNELVETVFDNHRIHPWEFDDEYVFTESSLLDQENFRVSNWVFLDSDKGLINENQEFDYDVYMVLRNLLKSH